MKKNKNLALLLLVLVLLLGYLFLEGINVYKEALVRNAPLPPVYYPPTPPVQVDDGSNAPKGIYVAGKFQQAMPQNVFDNPDVDGVFLRFEWEDIQTGPNTYNWSFVDSEFSRAVAAGKKVSAGVMAGNRTPLFVYSPQGNTPAVPYLEFIEGAHQGTVNVKPIRVPIPWNSTYLAYAKNFTQKFADHLKETPAHWNALSLVKFGLLNQSTLETRLPDQDDPQAPGDAFLRAAQKWLTVNYRPSKVMSAWTELLDKHMSAFDGKYISLSIIGAKNGFPYINEAGQIVSKGNTPDIAQMMLDDGYARYPTRFVSQWNALGATGGNTTITNLGAQGKLTGMQLNQGELGTPACLTNGTPCDNAMFQAVLQNGIDRHADFIEIFIDNVAAYPQAIKYASNIMVPPTIQTFGGNVETVTPPGASEIDRLPDLVVTDISFFKPNPLINSVTFRAKVKNQGGNATPPGKITGVAFYLDNQLVGCADGRTLSLPKNKTITVKMGTGSSFCAGGNLPTTWPKTSGTHTLKAVVDDINRITESNENNNIYTETVTW